MQRIGYVGDVHGRDTWIKKLSDVAVLDRTIFMGDYFDSHDPDISPLMQAENLEYILDIKKTSPDKITLLIGNHDMQYLDPKNKSLQCSNFSSKGASIYQSILQENWDLFDMASFEDFRLATHAGVTEHWLTLWLAATGVTSAKNFTVQHDVVEAMNDYLHKKHSKAIELMSIVGIKRGGMNRTGGPLWCDKSELIMNPVKGLDQVIGHTYVEHFYTHITEDNTTLHFCDNGLEEVLVMQEVTFEDDYSEYPTIM